MNRIKRFDPNFLPSSQHGKVICRVMRVQRTSVAGVAAQQAGYLKIQSAAEQVNSSS